MPLSQLSSFSNGEVLNFRQISAFTETKQPFQIGLEIILAFILNKYFPFFFFNRVLSIISLYWRQDNSGLFFTWTLDSGRLILSATSSLMKMSGYRVLAKRDSRTSSWERVNVVRSRLCFLGVAAQNYANT